LGLAHSYSRQKVATDVNRQDKPIIQTIALIEQMDKNINTFCMRLREWFSWHFPELSKIVQDNTIYAKLVFMLENKSNATEENLEAIEEITLDEDKARQIVEAAKISMGQDMGEADQIQLKTFSQRVVEQINFKQGIAEYLSNRLKAVSPNLSTLIGDNVAAKLISQAGSLINLSKAAASTI